MLVETALGLKPADIVITDGKLLDVYTGRILPHRAVAIAGERIAYVGHEASHIIGEKTKVIEANGRIISPGYIDAHTHLSKYWNIADFLKYAIPGGTTTFISEVESLGFVLGIEGVRAFLNQVQNRPVKIYSLIPPLITNSPATKILGITLDEARELLNDDRVIGLGETNWQEAVVKRNPYLLDLMRETLHAGKTVQGHAAGAFDKKLAAYAGAGVLSCHEAISTEDVISRLELGYYVMIREGYIRQDLKIIIPIMDTIDTRRLILVTDGSDPELLVNEGYLVDIVQKAVDLGFDPLKVVQMVSLNPAEHFGIDHLVGGISPGRFADILVLPAPWIMKPEIVISKGRIVAENGKMAIPLNRVPYPESLLRTVKIAPIIPSQLYIPAAGLGPYIRTIEIQLGGLVSHEGRFKAKSVNGEYIAEPENDLLKIVFIERVSGEGESFFGFIKGWGQRKGAVASTLCWNACGVVAIGTNDDDLAKAINRVIEIQGGIALSVQGNISLDIPFNVGGYVSEMSIENLCKHWHLFQKTLNDLGCGLRSPLLTLFTLTTVSIPFIRITEKGYFRFKEGDIIGL